MSIMRGAEEGLVSFLICCRVNTIMANMRRRVFTLLVLFFASVLALDIGLCQTSNEYINQGAENIVTGDLQKAMKDFNKAIELNPDDSRSYTGRGMVKMNMSDFKGALQDFNKAIELDPNNAYSYAGRGLLSML